MSMQSAFDEVSIVTKRILKKYPEYDINRQHYSSGDVVRNIKTKELCYIIESAVESCHCIIIESGFVMSKGTEAWISYADLEYFEYGKYNRPYYPISKPLRWEPGDIVLDNDTLFLVKERPEQNQRYVYAIALASDHPYVHIGECFAVEDPYWDYRRGLKDTRRCI